MEVAEHIDRTLVKCIVSGRGHPSLKTRKKATTKHKVLGKGNLVGPSLSLNYSKFDIHHEVVARHESFLNTDHLTHFSHPSRHA